MALLMSHEEIDQQHSSTRNNEAIATAFVTEHGTAGIASTV